MAKKKVTSENEAYTSRGLRVDRGQALGVPAGYKLGDMSRGNDGSSSPWTPPPSGKLKPGETAGKTKKTNPRPVLTPDGGYQEEESIDLPVEPVPMG